MERRDVNALTVCFFGVFFSFENERERERIYRVIREQERFWIPAFRVYTGVFAF